MLLSLYIKNYALIDELEIKFSDGLNIITGETGAGKSIMVDAFMVALGERASASSIRANEKKAIVEAFFDISGNESAINYLQENSIEYEAKELILRREITAGGSSRAFVCDSPVSLSILKGLGDLLADFHGQHEHQLLLNSKYHLQVLDAVCSFGEIKQKYLAEYNLLKKYADEYYKLSQSSKEANIRLDHYVYELDEINKINPKPDELDEIEARLNLVENSEKVFSLCSAVNDILDESDAAVSRRLLDCRKYLEQLNNIDESFQDYLAECNSAIISVQEIAKFSANYKDKFSYNAEEIESIRLRALELNGLRKKYGSYEEVFVRKEYLQDEINSIANFDETLAEIEKNIYLSQRRLGEIALSISDIRKQSAEAFAAKLVDKLKYLEMDNSEFDVRFRYQSADDKSIKAVVLIDDKEESYAVNRDGIDVVEFYISTNKGESPKPLKDTASGGEISRIMLSLKSITAEYQSMPMLVFDEIDTGISGKVGLKTGLVMKDLAKHHQILAITHLPQIAALGDNNLFVSKRETDERTLTEIHTLSEAEKINAIAQMLSGETITEAAIESAKELIANKI